MQEFVVGILFIGALVYLVGIFKKDFRPSNKGCAKGCGNCGQIDISKIKDKNSKYETLV